MSREQQVQKSRGVSGSGEKVSLSSSGPSKVFFWHLPASLDRLPALLSFESLYLNTSSQRVEESTQIILYSWPSPTPILPFLCSDDWPELTERVQFSKCLLQSLVGDTISRECDGGKPGSQRRTRIMRQLEGLDNLRNSFEFSYVNRNRTLQVQLEELKEKQFPHQPTQIKAQDGGGGALP